MAALATPAAASAAASRLYWSDKGSGQIVVGSVEGGSVAPVLTSPAATGVALDPASGRIYWAQYGGVGEDTGAIKVADIDGHGQETLVSGMEEGVDGVAVDPAADKMFWANEDTNTIEAANLDGSDVETLYEGQNVAVGVVVDPSTEKLYWANWEGEQIMEGSIDGGEPTVLFSGVNGPEDVAVDAATDRIYWTVARSNEIQGGSLGGESDGKPETLFTEAGHYPWGIALDAEAGKLFWSGVQGDTVLSGGLEEATGAANGTVLYRELEEPEFLALLGSPVGTAAPVVSGEAAVGDKLACSQGGWAADLPEASDYRAPASFAYQWLKSGVAIAGATSATFTPSEAGSYTCRVTAGNAAGETAQTSAATSVSTAAPAVTPTAAVTPAPTPAPAPAPAPAPGPSLPSIKPAVLITHVQKLVRHREAKITLECAGAACSGHLSLAWVHGGTARLLWHSLYTLAAGRSKTYVAKLRPQALKRLQKAAGTLRVRVRATVKGGRTVRRFSSLKLQ